MSEAPPNPPLETADHSAAAPAGDGTPPLRVPGHDILEKIGEGGMGVVYKARQLAADRVVAVKAIKPAGSEDAAALSRFRNEARRVARVRHPHVIQIHEVGEVDGLPYFTMEFCPGGGLDARLAGTPLAPKEAAALVEALARAVQAAHDLGVIHRDLKPANVLLAADGSPRITDFGLAKQLDDDADPTVSRAVLGTPSYMAPEQTLGKRGAAGPAADVYSLGAILYECLTGRPPFLAATAVDTLLLVRSAAPAAPAQLQPKTPRDLETICLKCLHKEPGRRYASASALAEDLRRFQAGEPIAARPVGAAERLVKWARRRPAAAALLAGLVAALAAGTAVSTYFAAEAGRRAAAADASTARARDNEKITREKTNLIHDREEAANQARREAEATTARGLLRTLAAQSTGPPDDIEMDALWDVAATRGDSARVRFIDEALQSPERVRPLVGRRDFALHAVVGIDSDRRRRVEAKLLAVLRDDRADPELRADCGILGAALGLHDAALARACILALAEAPAANGAPSPLKARPGASPTTPQVLIGLAQYLDHDGAVDAADALVRAMKRAGDPNTVRLMASVLAAVLDRLPPDERVKPAVEAAHALADAMTASAPTRNLYIASLVQVLDRLPPGAANGPAGDVARALTAALNAAPAQQADWELSQTANALAQLAGLLDPPAAAEAARALVAAMGRSKNANQISSLDFSLASLLAHLPPAERVALAREAARAAAAVAAQSPTPPPGPATMRVFDQLANDADQLDADAAADAARVLTDALAGTTNDYERNGLVKALQAVVPRLDAAHAAALAQSLENLSSTAKPAARGRIGEVLGLVLDRLPPDDAAKAAGEAANALTDVLFGLDRASGSDYAATQALTAGIMALAKRLDAQGESALARRYADAATRTSNSYVASAILQVLPSLSDRRGSEGACDAAEALVVATSRRQPIYWPAFGNQSAKGFPDVCARLNPADAAYITRALADALTQNPAVPDAMVKAAADRLDPENATAVAGWLAAMIARRPDAGRTAALARVLVAVLPGLPPQEAARRTRDAARLLADALKKSLNDAASAQGQNQWAAVTATRTLAPAWTALLDRLPPDEANPLIQDACRAMIDAVDGAADRMTSADPTGRVAAAAVVSNLTPVLSSLLQRLPPDRAGELAKHAAHALADAGKTAGDGWGTRSALAPSLAGVLERLPPDQAAPLARDGVQGFADALRAAPNAGTLAGSAAAGLSLLRFLPQEEAGPLTKEVVRALAGRLKQVRTADPTGLPGRQESELTPLINSLSALASRLDHEDMVLIAHSAADALGGMEVAQDRENLVKSLTQLMTTWDRDAPATAQALTDAADPDAAGFAPLMEILGALVRRLKPEEVPAKAPGLLAEALVRTAGRMAPDDLCECLESCADRFDHDGAAAFARRLADVLSANPEAAGEDGVARALGIMLDRLPPEEAGAIAARPAQVLTDVWKKLYTSLGRPETLDYRPTRALVLVSALTSGLEDDDRPPFVFPRRSVRRCVALFVWSPNPFGASAELALLGQLPQSRLSTQALVDLLKRPNCIGATADVVLEELGRQCGRRFGDVWDFVEWAEKNRPDLDLKSPPRRELP